MYIQVTGIDINVFYESAVPESNKRFASVLLLLEIILLPGLRDSGRLGVILLEVSLYFPRVVSSSFSSVEFRAAFLKMSP